MVIVHCSVLLTHNKVCPLNNFLPKNQTMQNIGEQRNVFVSLRNKMGVEHIKIRAKNNTLTESVILLTLLEASVLPNIEKNQKTTTWHFSNGRRKIQVFFANLDKSVYLKKFLSVEQNYEIASVVELELEEYLRLLKVIESSKQPQVEQWSPDSED